MRKDTENSLDCLPATFEARSGGLDAIKRRIREHKIETPSWAYGPSGTRFKTFPQAGAARNVFEKIADAAVVHAYTGAAPYVALHLAWDKADDYRDLARFAEARGIRIRSINPDLFSEDEYRLGSLTNEDPSVRRKTIEHLLHSIEVGKATHSEIQSLWFGDGTNFPAQGDFRRRKHWLLEGLRNVYDALPPEMYLMIEYKLFEPAFYHTDIADWGMAYTLCTHLGERAKVLVDLGHHALGTNIEHIVAFLIDENRLGGFHLNGKKYADDDLIAGSINPYELFLIYVEIAAAEADLDMQGKIGFMLDQSHNVEAKIEAVIHTIMVCQAAYTRALLVDRAALQEAQREGDVIRTQEILLDAYHTDVRPLLAQVRVEQGLSPNPLEAFRASGYARKFAEARAR